MRKEKKIIESDVRAEGIVFVTVFFDRVAYGQNYLTRRVYALSNFSIELDHSAKLPSIPDHMKFILTGTVDGSLGNVDVIEAVEDKQLFETVKELRDSLRIRSALQPVLPGLPLEAVNKLRGDLKKFGARFDVTSEESILEAYREYVEETIEDRKWSPKKADRVNE